MVDNVLQTGWLIFSQINGNPDLNQSATRFCLALFFLILLYSTIRMRTLSQYKPHQVVALCGCVIMMIREITMLVTIGGWETKVITDTMVHFLWPPIEHMLELTAYICFVWYTIEASQWNVIRRFARNIGWYFIGASSIFCIYTMYAWKLFFISHAPEILYSYKHFSGDWQTHLILAFVAFMGVISAFMKSKGTSYLLGFWTIVLIEHIIRTIVFGFFDEQSWQATIFHAMHTWSIPLLLLHFINSYVLKMGNCVECKRELANLN